MDRYFTLSGETQVLAAVTMLATAKAGDTLHVLEDEPSIRNGLGQRFDKVLPARGFPVRRVALQWTDDEVPLPPDLPAAGTGCDRFIATSGRARERLLLTDMMRRRAFHQGRDFELLTVGEWPPRIEILRFRPYADPLIERRPLACALPITLDEALMLSNFQRTAKKPGMRWTSVNEAAKAKLPPPIKKGDRLEQRVLRSLPHCLSPSYKSALAEVWFGVEIQRIGGNNVASEFDVLLLMRDGRALHLECKSGDRTAKDLQAKTQQMRNALTAHSGMVLCISGTGDSARDAQAQKGTFRTHENLHRFGVCVVPPRGHLNQESLQVALSAATW